MNHQLLILDNALKPPDALEFLSARGMARYQNLYTSVCKLDGDFTFDAAKKLAQAIGPYCLSDSLVRTLRSKGISLKDGIVPFASPLDALSEIWLARCQEKTYTVLEIKNFFAEHSLLPLAVYVDRQSIQAIQSVQRVKSGQMDFWQDVEVVDALECHRNPILYFSTRQVS
jgi:hypothetical protein